MSSMENSISIVNELQLLANFIEAGQFDESGRKSGKYIGLIIKEWPQHRHRRLRSTAPPPFTLTFKLYRFHLGIPANPGNKLRNKLIEQIKQ